MALANILMELAFAGLLIVVAGVTGWKWGADRIKRKQKDATDRLIERLKDVPDESDDPDANREWLRKHGRH